MSFGFGFGFPSWRTLAGGFSPAALFVGGQQGFFYDPSDLSTLFQDSAGTTPVTGVEQVVGLMLDKSKGLVLGPELVVNGDFSVDADWTKGTGWTITGGAAVYDGSAGTNDLFQNCTYTGSLVKITGVISNLASGGFRLRPNRNSSASQITISANGAFTVYLQSPGTGVFAFGVSSQSTSANATIDNISVRELPGNHATSTGAARPTLSARVNLLTKTEQFDDGVWAKTNATVTANTVVAPDGTLTGDRIVDNNAGGTGVVGVTLNVTIANAPHIFSVFFKADGLTWAVIAASGFGAAPQSGTSYFDLANGTLGAFNQLNASIESFGNGWYKCSGTLIPDAGDLTGTFAFYVADGNSDIVVDRDGTSSIYIWGADLRVANDGVGIPAYQRVNTATDYDSSGFPLYLRFGGTQAMSTGSIDFTATDKMSVFAGVRKFNNTTQQFIVETSTNSNLNNGAFALLTNTNSGGGTVAGAYGGTFGGTSVAGYGATGTTAPISNVVTALGNIAAATDASILRVNGTQVATSGATSAGTGNFGTYPMYIASRQGVAPNLLEGRIYSLIGVGSAVSAGNISATESWVNGRTNAY